MVDGTQFSFHENNRNVVGENVQQYKQTVHNICDKAYRPFNSARATPARRTAFMKDAEETNDVTLVFLPLMPISR